MYFGLPSLQNYLEKRTFFVETQRRLKNSDLPMITISRFGHYQARSEEVNDCSKKRDLNKSLECIENGRYSIVNASNLEIRLILHFH